jgi:hypothetical protein
MIAKDYKWSANERLWLEEHGITPDTYIGAKIVLPKARRTRPIKAKK